MVRSGSTEAIGRGSTQRFSEAFFRLFTLFEFKLQVGPKKLALAQLEPIISTQKIAVNRYQLAQCTRLLAS